LLISEASTVKRLFIVLVAFIFPGALFTLYRCWKSPVKTRLCYFAPLFLKVLFYHIRHWEFLVLTQNIPWIIVSEIEGHINIATDIWHWSLLWVFRIESAVMIYWPWW
jgi:hypothetical protein